MDGKNEAIKIAIYGILLGILFGLILSGLWDEVDTETKYAPYIDGLKSNISVITSKSISCQIELDFTRNLLTECLNISDERICEHIYGNG